MVVRMRHTRSHTANRRSHHALKSPALSKDASGTLHIRHRATLDGMYKGRSVTGDPVKKVMKKQGIKTTKKVAKKAPAKKKVVKKAKK
ncbi:MAG: 50S ribosomal protein L32 [Candidatus Pacebacteria bacterium]|nr:50S ribosomal protein L32 [Candidatus Paceibacterota bacterium]